MWKYREKRPGRCSITTVFPVRILVPEKTTLPRPQAGTGVPVGAARSTPW